MAAEYDKVFNMQGFDIDASPRWQMVPTDGDRYMALRDGAGLTVTASNAKLTVTEIPRSSIPAVGERMTLHSTDRILKLHGVTKGAVKVQAKNAAGVLVVELDVNVKDRKDVKLTFNFVTDSAGHHTTRSRASAAQWVKEISYIYNGQANVFPALRATRPAPIASNLGDVVMWTPGASSEWNTVVAQGDSGADMNYFMVWEYEQDSTPYVDDTDAGTLGGNCIFEDHAGVAITASMAHEMGHFLGRPDHYDATRKKDLMYGITDQRGWNLTRDDVNVMNP